MQHEHVLKKLTFDLLTPSLGLVGGVCGQNICYHVAAFLILFYLICNMTVLACSEKVEFGPILLFSVIMSA